MAYINGKEILFSPTINYGYDKGYDKGYDDGKKVGQYDLSIVAENSGLGRVTTTYVHPKEHDVEVKLTSDTITDFSGIVVKRVSKNLFDGNQEFDFKKSGVTKEFKDNVLTLKSNVMVANYRFKIPVSKGKKYTISASSLYMSADVYGLYIGNTTNQDKQEYGLVTPTKLSLTFTATTDILYIKGYVGWAGEQEVIVTDLQLEEWDMATEYEPYTETAYTANADGTVEGITSIAPVMSIVTEAENVTINSKCCRDKDYQYDNFWDTAQKNGGQMPRYNFLFASPVWNGSTFRPKYSIKSNTKTSFANCFAYWQGEAISLIDRCAELGIEIDFSNANTLSSCFNSNLAVTEIGVVDIRNSTNNGSMFAYCNKLKKIEKIIFKEDGTTSSIGDMFTQCYQLKEIRFEGVIGKSISFSYCELLTEASVVNIIEHLMTITDGVARTLTLHATVKAKLSDEQKATITTTKGWTLA